MSGTGYFFEADKLCSKLSKSPQNESQFDSDQASHFPNDYDYTGARQRVEQGILGGVSPVQFSSDIDTMNSHYGMRDTIRFATLLHEKRQGVGKAGDNPVSATDALQFTKEKDQKRVEAVLADKNFLVASNRGPVVKKNQLSLSAGGLATAMRGALGGGGTWISNSGKNPPIHELFAGMAQYSHTVDQFSPDSQHFESLLNPLGLHNERVYRPGLNKKFLEGDVESKEPFDVSHFSMDKSAFSAFYENVVNGWLWPIFHNLLEFAIAAPEDWEKYRETNQTFADSLFAGFSSEKDNITWIQDYQLLLVSGMLREKIKKDTDRIGFFLHIPFTNPDAFIEQLGEFRIVEIVHSLLQSDVVGLQMQDDAEQFIKLVRKLSKPLRIDESKIRQNGQGDFSVPVGRRIVTVRAFPISMDYEAQHETGASRSVEQARAVVKRKFDGQVQSYPKTKGGVERRYDIADVDATKATIDDPKSIWIGGIERADYAKGLHQRIDAIGLYFNENIQELSESGYKPIFMLTLAPSREDVPTYKKYVDTLYGKINHVNQSFQRELGYAPIVLTGPVFDPEKSDLFAAYDVFVVTSLSDGMNLTPLEVISAKHLDEEHDHHPAVFLLSKGAGVGRRAEFAKHGHTLDRTMGPEMINGQLKRGINDVIASREDPKKMQEIVEKNKSMQAFVQENEIMKWAADFLEELVVESEGVEPESEFPDPGLDVSDEVSVAPLAAPISMPTQWQQRPQWNKPNPGSQRYRQNRPPLVRPRPSGRLFKAMRGLRPLRKFIRK